MNGIRSTSTKVPGVTMEAVTLRRTDWQNLGGLFALAVCLGELAGVWRHLGPLLDAWSQEEYSHAWFILPLSALIFIQRFRSAQLGGGTAPGILVAIISIVIMILAWATGSY